MKRKCFALLAASVVAALLLGLATAATAQYTQITSWPNIQYTGVTTNRGFALNKNAGSPYYGYVYVCDGTTGARTLRELRPEPVGSGTGTTTYVETGATFGTPGGDLIPDAFVGSDDTVWIPNYSQKKIFAGNPADHTITAQFSTTQAPRGVWVNGQLGVAGTRAYVAESSWANPAFLDDCEIFEYDGSAWNRVAELGALNLRHTFAVTADAAGNSYWLGCSSTAPYVVKVKPDFTVDTTFTWNRPSWDIGTFLPSDIEYVSDPTNPAGFQEYLYISWFSGSSGIMRTDLNGNYIDGGGSHWNCPGYPSNYDGLEFADPGANDIIYLAVDDNRRVYVLAQQYDWASYPNGVYTSGLIKVSLHEPLPPNPPTNLATSNDIYGQVKLTWTEAVPQETQTPVTGYKVYRSTTTTKPSTPYATIVDTCPRWKDAEQGQTPGGPFYYWVTALYRNGQSAAAGPVGPAAPTSSTAPTPRSLNSALGYSEISKLDTVECANFDRFLAGAQSFLDRRGVDYTVVWDKDPAHLNIENDDIAGHTLLILPLNRDMTSYGAQCIKDYVKYSQGRVWSAYFNGVAAPPNFATLSEFMLSDVYRVNYVGWSSSNVSDTLPWDYLKFRYLKPDQAVLATIANGAVLFDGIPDGVVQSGNSTISMIVTPYTDGTAKSAGIWTSGDGGYHPYPDGDPKNTGLVIGYVGDEVRSLYTGLLWWYRTAEYELDGGGRGSFSATKFTENILTFFGIPFTPQSSVGGNLGANKVDLGDGNRVAYTDAVVTETLIDYSTSDYVLYIETQDRTSGIKVRLARSINPDFAPGDVVSVSGTLESESEEYTDPDDGTTNTTWGDRVLNAVEIIKTGTADVPKPLMLLNKNVVGAWSSNWHQNGAWVGNGLNNLGLYITITGKVTFIEDSSWSINYFYIDDGSNLVDGTTHDSGGTPVPNVGIRVIAPSWELNMAPAGFEVGKSVTLSGCSALELVGLGGDNGIPAVRIPGTNDIVVNN